MKLIYFSIAIGLVVIGYKLYIRSSILDKQKELKVINKNMYTAPSAFTIISLVLIVAIVLYLIFFDFNEEQLALGILMCMVIVAELSNYKIDNTVYYDKNRIIYKDNSILRSSIKHTSKGKAGNIKLHMYNGETKEIPRKFYEKLKGEELDE